jgi:hypothetical protein
MVQAIEDTTLVTQLRPKADPTNAERRQRHRAKQRKRRATAAPRTAAGVTPTTVSPSTAVALRCAPQPWQRREAVPA